MRRQPFIGQFELEFMTLVAEEAWLRTRGVDASIETSHPIAGAVIAMARRLYHYYGMAPFLRDEAENGGAPD